jgi:hypothetical protein
MAIAHSVAGSAVRRTPDPACDIAAPKAMVEAAGGEGKKLSPPAFFAAPSG